MDTIKLYRAADGIRWTRYNGENGKVVGASTQGYSNEFDAKVNIEATQAQPFKLVTDYKS